MEPFSILCTTCQARLRVRDESAVGQILACPKCGSMVMVHAPDPSDEPAEAAAKSPAQPNSVDTGTEEDKPSPGSKPSTGKTANTKSAPRRPTPTKEAARQSLTAKPPAAEVEPNKTPISDTPPEDSSGSNRPARTFKFREDFEMPTEAPDLNVPRKPVTPAPPRQSAAAAAEAST